MDKPVKYHIIKPQSSKLQVSKKVGWAYGFKYLLTEGHFHLSFPFAIRSINQKERKPIESVSQLSNTIKKKPGKFIMLAKYKLIESITSINKNPHTILKIYLATGNNPHHPSVDHACTAIYRAETPVRKLSSSIRMEVLSKGVPEDLWLIWQITACLKTIYKKINTKMTVPIWNWSKFAVEGILHCLKSRELRATTNKKIHRQFQRYTADIRLLSAAYSEQKMCQLQKLCTSLLYWQSLHFSPSLASHFLSLTVIFNPQIGQENRNCAKTTMQMVK